jgi:hypothetical protein
LVPVPTTATGNPAAVSQFNAGNFTFGSIVGGTRAGAGAGAGAGAAATAAPVVSSATLGSNGTKLSNTAVEAMQKLAELQRQSHSTALASQPFHHSSSSQKKAPYGRVLGPGFVSGGSLSVESGAEIMRLTAQVESMNQKLKVQSEKLQRTEASLVNANKLHEKERSQSNANMMSANSKIHDLKQKENQLSKCCADLTSRLNQQTVVNTASAGGTFELAAKRAEEFDEQLTVWKDKVETLSSEKESLETQISSLMKDADDAKTTFETEANSYKEKLSKASQESEIAKDMAQLASTQLSKQDAELSQLRQALAERDFLNPDGKDAVACSESAARAEDASQEISDLKNVLSRLEGELASAISARDSNKAKFDELNEQYDAMRNECRDAIDAREHAEQASEALAFDYDVKLDSMETDLKATKQKLANNEEIIESLQCENSSRSMYSFEIKSNIHTECCGYKCEHHGADEADEGDEGDEDEEGDGGGAGDATRAVFADEQVARTIPRRAMLSAACAAALEPARLGFDVHHYELNTDAIDEQEHMKKILKSVSADITSACIQMRRTYLQNMGYDSEQVEEHMQEYIVA